MSITRLFFRGLVALLAFGSVAADFPEVSPFVFGPDDSRTKDLVKTMGADARKRVQDASLRESREFAAVASKEQWEKYRDQRLQALRSSLGTFPEMPKDVRVVVTRRIEGEGYVIQNTLYESRPGFWVAANLYLPTNPPPRMPGIILAHSHHGGKTGGELQDMGMTWARAGVAVLVPDQLGYGERRQHDFHTEADYPKPYRVSRQDYFFRYHSNLQLTAVGESLMGWMAWDLMRGVDVLLKQPGIDPQRIILMGSVAGGGDPAGVTAALDNRIACVVPFNFGGWQPESNVLENPDRDFAWFGDGYWESTRGLRDGAREGFAHFVIVGSIAPRKLIHAHEFAWDAMKDPTWPRLQKIFNFYTAGDSLRFTHGRGSVKGRPPESSHCNHIGAVHRKMIYPALKDWFDMPIPVEYSQQRPSAELRCWTDAARKELQPKTLAEMAGTLAQERRETGSWDEMRSAWTRRLGHIEPVANPRVVELASEEVPGGTLARFTLETDPGILVPVYLMTPRNSEGKTPVVVMVASAGKQAFLKERGDAIEAMLRSGIAVSLVDVRGTGETRPGTSADRGSARTSVSQTNLILGQPVLGSQLRDLRTVLRWLPTRDRIDGTRLAVWGDSFAKVNPPDVRLAVPQDLEPLAISEPGGANLAILAALFEKDVVASYARGGLDVKENLSSGPYLNLPHDAIVPGPMLVGSLASVVGKSRAVAYEGTVDAQNRETGPRPMPMAGAAKWMIEKVRAK